MNQIKSAWGGLSGPRYEKLASHFKPTFDKIAEGAAERDTKRILPFEQIDLLKQLRFGALRLPEKDGGYGATLPELFNLLIELSAADPNITQALRAHFAFVEDILNARSVERRKLWLPRFAEGQLVGVAWTEVGSAAQLDYGTRLSRKNGKLVLNGTKYYTTGSLFADWIDTGATDENGEVSIVTVQRTAPGVDVVDDWDGFGQTLTASGTTNFVDVPVEPSDIVDASERFAYATGFVQLVLLAAVAGIGRAATQDVAREVAKRTRTFTHAAAPLPKIDPQVLQVVGRVRSAAYGAGVVVLHSAEALERVYQALLANDPEAVDAANTVAEIESAQAQIVVTNLVLDASTVLFDALAASATKKPTALDRHWRNARTITSHNPRIYKERIIGDFAVNGTPPPYQWRIGQTVPDATTADAGKEAQLQKN